MKVFRFFYHLSQEPLTFQSFQGVKDIVRVMFSNVPHLGENGYYHPEI